VVRVCGLAAGVLAVIGMGVAPRAGAQNPTTNPPAKPADVRIGFPQPMFKDIPESMIQVAAKPFQEMLQKIAGINGTMDVCPDYKVLADKLGKGKIDIAVFHGFEYAWVKDEVPGLEPIVVTVPNCGKVQACLVVHVNSKATEPKDLKGVCVAMHKGCKAHCQMYLDRLQEQLPAGCCCPLKPAGQTPAEVLDAVVGGACEAALVDIAALKAYQSNTPGLGRQLKILAQSEELPSAIVVYRKGSLTDKQVKAIRDGLLNCTKTAQGQIFAMFWGLKGFGDVTDGYRKLLDKTLEAYPAPNPGQK
jgi:ABC-type phosphate/phosphonate transport system substrate-binding protein